MITTDHKSYRKQKVDYPNHQPGNRGFVHIEFCLGILGGDTIPNSDTGTSFCKKRRADKAGRGFPAIPGLTVDWPT
jgi:hypothetical protein